MKIPNKLKIGGHNFTVKKQKVERGFGYCDFANNTIVLNPEYKKSQQEATLIHEIFHAINAQFDDSPISHALLESLSQQFYQVLSDNKLLK